MATANTITRLRVAKAQLEAIERQDEERRRYIAGQRRVARFRFWLPRVAAFMTGFLICQGLHLWLILGG